MRSLGLMFGAVVLFSLGAIGTPTLIGSLASATDIDPMPPMEPHLEAVRTGARASLAPALEAFTASLVFQVDSQVKLGSRITVASFLPGDTAVYQYYRSDSLLSSRRLVKLADSLFVSVPPYSSTTLFKGCVTVERGGRASGLKSARPCWTWSFVRGAAPLVPPVITTLERIVLYGIPTVPGGPWARRVAADGTLAVATDSNTVRFCALGYLTSQTWVLAENSKPYPPCDSVLTVRQAERRV